MSGNGKTRRNSTFQERRRESRPNRQSGSDASDSQVHAFSKNDGAMEPQGLDLGQDGWSCEAFSSCGAGEGRDAETPRSSQLRCSNCANLVHELSNTMTAVLMNAQLLEWRLPPYSRLKRPVLEVERNAQRGGELLKRLSRQLEGTYQPRSAAELGWSDEVLTAVTAQEPTAAATANWQQRFSTAAAPVSSTEHAELTLDCDPCTSSFFPKGDDGNER